LKRAHSLLANLAKEGGRATNKIFPFLVGADGVVGSTSD
jgi:hypothetical protein